MGLKSILMGTLHHVYQHMMTIRLRERQPENTGTQRGKQFVSTIFFSTLYFAVSLQDSIERNGKQNGTYQCK